MRVTRSPRRSSPQLLAKRYTARVRKIGDRKTTASTLLLGCALLAGGCASKQRIPLECVPKDVTIYVDKKQLDSVPDELELRTDEPHTLFFKRKGYESKLVVLDSQDTDVGPVLSPMDVCVELHFIEQSRNVQFEVEKEN